MDRKNCIQFLFPGIPLLFLAALLTSCPAGNKPPGEDDVTVTYTVTVSDNIDHIDVTLLLPDGSPEIGTIGDGQSVQPERFEMESGSGEWNYTMTYEDPERIFYSITVLNDDQFDISASGNVSEYDGVLLHDGSAPFTDAVSAGDIVYNSTDDISAVIVSRDSSSQLTLDKSLFDEAKRKYIIHFSGAVLAFGTTTGTDSNRLIDSEQKFDLRGIESGNYAANLDTHQETTVSSVIDEDELSVDDDYFTEDDRYLVGRKLEGTTDSTGRNSVLKDDDVADFRDSDLGVSVGNLVRKIGTDLYAYVISIEEHVLVLSDDIFSTAGGENYKIFTSQSAEGLSTTSSSSRLIDRTETTAFYQITKKGDIVYNTYTGTYSPVTQVADNKTLKLETDLFPPLPIEYTVYKTKSLTLEIKIGDGDSAELYKSITTSHWNRVEAMLTGTITQQDLQAYRSE